MKTMMSAVLGASMILPGAALAIQDSDEDEPRLFTAQDVFALEWANDPQVSPDGELIAYVRNSYDRANDTPAGDIWLIDISSGEQRPLVTGDGSYAAPRWSPSGDRLLYVGAEPGGEPELRIRYMDSGAEFTVAQLFEAPQAPHWSPDGRQIAFSMFTKGETPGFSDPIEAPEGAEWAEPVKVYDDVVIRFDGQGWLRDGAAHAYVVPANGGTPRQLTEGENGFTVAGWLDDETVLATGNDVEDAALDPIESEIYAIDVDSEAREALTGRDGPDSSPVVSPDGERIAYLGFDDERLSYQQNDLWVMNLEEEGEPRNLTEDYDHPVSSPQWRGGDALVALAEVEGQTALVSISLDGDVSELTDDVGGTDMGRPYSSGAFSVTKDGRPVIAYTQSRPDRPADVAVLRGRGEAKRLTNLNEDALGHIDLAEIEEIQIESSAGGETIEAWIAKPPGFEADGSYPMILEIHGGPFASYGPYFAAEIQRYAAEGYVVVYANPRGSTGYGEDFAHLIDLAYPGEDYDDLMSVTDWMVENDYADPDRLFVTGGSGGGVLTAWIVGNTDRFAAAATIKPVINWTTMALMGDISAYVSRHWLRAMPWEDPELYWKLSPISKAGNVTTPTLVMVGEEDWRTPAFEAEQFYGALKLQDVDTALVRVPGAPHHIATRPSQLIAKTANIMGWFEKYDPAKDETDDSGSEDAGEAEN